MIFHCFLKNISTYYDETDFYRRVKMNVGYQIPKHNPLLDNVTQASQCLIYQIYIFLKQNTGYYRFTKCQNIGFYRLVPMIMQC